MRTGSGGTAASIGVATPEPGVVLLRVRGAIDRRAVGRLRDKLDRLTGPADHPVRVLEIDLSDVGRCDVRALVVLDGARQRLHAVRARFAVRGLDPGVLTSWADAGLGELFAVYRAARDILGSDRPDETGGPTLKPVFGPADGRLAQACLDLATVRRTAGGAVDVAAVSRHLVDLCARSFGVDAAVVLTGRTPGRWAVGAASSEGTRRLVVAGLIADQGPVADCLHHGGPVGAPDLSALHRQWPRYAGLARQHGVRAARTLPLRPPGRSRYPLPVGALVLFSSTGGTWAPADLAVAQAFADLAAVAIGSGGDALASGADDHVVIEQAVGVIRERAGVDAAAARELLLDGARSRDLRLGETAHAIVAGAVDPTTLRAQAPTAFTPTTP